MFQLFLGQTFYYVIAKCRASTIFRKGNARPFGPFFKHLLFINTASKFDIIPFHFFLFATFGSKARLSFVATKTHLELPTNFKLGGYNRPYGLNGNFNSDRKAFLKNIQEDSEILGKS